MKPKSEHISTIYANTTKTNSNFLLKYAALNPFKTVPKSICATPNNTLIFILKLLKYMISCCDLNHVGSKPNG